VEIFSTPTLTSVGYFAALLKVTVEGNAVQVTPVVLMVIGSCVLKNHFVPALTVPLVAETVENLLISASASKSVVLVRTQVVALPPIVDKTKRPLLAPEPPPWFLTKTLVLDEVMLTPSTIKVVAAPDAVKVPSAADHVGVFGSAAVVATAAAVKFIAVAGDIALIYLRSLRSVTLFTALKPGALPFAKDDG
jgi:hypothetical protein